MPPLVSVVTPVYNGVKYLVECIESVLAQTYGNWEYVVLDNASTDGTAELLDRYATAERRVRVFRNDVTVPYIENWNRALRLMDADGRYCKVVHADDWLEEDCLAAMVDLAEAHPDVGIVGSWIGRGEEIMARWEEAPGDVVDGRELGRKSLLGEVPYLFGSPSALLMRSDLVRARGEFYPRVDHPLVDQHVCYELLRHIHFGYVPRVLSHNRLHGESITSEQEDTNEWFVGKLTLLAEHGPWYLTEDELADRIEHYLERYYRFLARQIGRSRGSEFWAYHARALTGLGIPLDRSRLWREALLQAPGRVRRYVGRRSRARKGPPESRTQRMSDDS